ncbi:MAG: hypothetical protein ACX93T_04180, partial [Bacteroidota bacterium]
MLKYNRGVYAALILWFATVLSGCSRSMVNMEHWREDERPQKRIRMVSSTSNSHGMGFAYLVHSSYHGATEAGQQGSVAIGNAPNAAVMNSPHDTAVGRVALGVANNANAFSPMAAQGGQDTLVGDQGSGVAGGRATMVSQQQSPPYPTVYGGYRAFGAQAWQAYFGVDV